MPENPHHVYDGAEYAVPHTPQAEAPRPAKVHSDAMSAGAHAVYLNIADFEEETYDRMEYATDQHHKQRLAELQAKGEEEDIRRFNLPDGHKDSFFEQNGTYREAAFRQYKADRQREFDGLTAGYIRLESRKKASEQVAEIKAAIGKGLDIKMAQSLTPRARKATLSLAAAQEDAGQYGLAAATILGAPDYALSTDDKKLELQRLERKVILADIQNAVLTGDTETYLRAVSNPAVMAKLTADEKNRVYELQRALAAETSFADTQVPLDGEEKNTGKPAETTGKPSHLGLPMGVSDELVKLYDNWNLYADKDALKNEEMQRQARQALDSFAGSYFAPNSTAEDIAHFKNIASCFGVSGEEAEAIVKKYVDALKPTRNFDLNKTLDLAKSHRLLTPRTLQAQLQNKRKEKATYIAQAQKTGEAPDTEAYDSILAIVESRISDFTSTLEANCRTRYADWLAAQGDGKHLTDADREMALLNIMDEEKEKLLQDFAIDAASADDIINSALYRAADAEQTRLETAAEDAINRREELVKNISETNEKRLAADIAAKQRDAYNQAGSKAQKDAAKKAASLYARTDISIHDANNIENTYTQSYIAVPKGDQLAGKTVAFKHNRRTHTFECREADVSTPTLTVKAQASLGLIGSKNSWALSYDTEGRAVLTNTTPPEKDFNMYRTIMQGELRRDEYGRIAVYNLPKEDGGGTYEIAGINDKYHPEEAAKLKKMVEAGLDDSIIERVIMSYYKQFTQDGAALIAPASDSKGLELFMRDCALNHGPAGAANVLRKAIGAGSKDNLNASVADYVSRYGEQALLDALKRGREQYYIDIIRRNPEKARFARGWANRLNTIYRASYSALRQRSTSY